jgi:DNA polymerase-3 subunit delta'
MDINWLDNQVQSWRDRVNRQRLPHAVLLAGPKGVGKRALGTWIARTRLGIAALDSMPVYPLRIPAHADLHWIRPAEDKETISINQVRALVHDLGLTSYEGHGKVAVIEPANAMTMNAANSLLKTLEEPPGDALLILVADRVGHLPATVLSRCQRIDLAPPQEGEVLAWLDHLRPGAPWAEALRVAGGAPLAAVDALDELETSGGLGRDLAALSAGRESPVTVAERWAKLAPDYLLNWLAQQVKMAIIAHSTGRERTPGLAIDDSVLRRMDRRNLFCYLDIINRLRGQAKGSYNVQLTLESLLIDWAEDLRECGPEDRTDGMNLMLAGR